MVKIEINLTILFIQSEYSEDIQVLFGLDAYTGLEI